MDNLKQNAILVRDALGSLLAYATHDRACSVMQEANPGCYCGFRDVEANAAKALIAAQALVDGLGDARQAKPCSEARASLRYNLEDALRYNIIENASEIVGLIIKLIDASRERE